MGLVQTTAPDTEPLTTAQAKTHLRITHDDDDTYIDTLVAAARGVAETVTKKQLVTAEWTWTLDRFPRSGRIFNVPRPPLQSVGSINYVDENGDSQLWDSSNYDVDTSSVQGRIAEAFGVSWPGTRPQMEAVTIVFDAGYGAAETVPATITRGMLFLVGHMYENREEVVIGQGSKRIEEASESLFMTEKVLLAT